MPQNKKQSGRPKSQRITRRQDSNSDSVFFFKLLLYVLLGSLWLKFTSHNSLHIPLPIGVAAGLFFTSHEHFRIDRKIEYAVLLVAMLIGYFIPFGLFVNLS